MVPTKVEDVFHKGFDTVGKSYTLSNCLSLLEEKETPVLFILDDAGKCEGVIARRWIARAKLDPSTTKVKTLMRPAPSVNLQDSLGKAAKLMIESGTRQLPVYSGEKLVGVITDENVIHGAVMEKWGNTEVKKIMTKKPFVVEEDDSVGAVLSLFRQHSISHAPVIRDGKLSGIVSIHDIIEHIFQPRKRQTVGERVGEKVQVLSIPAKAIMSEQVITVLPTNTLRDATNEMHKFDISSLVVVRKGRPIGIVTKRDFLEPIAQTIAPLRKISIQFSLTDVGIDETQQGFIMDDFKSFAQKYREAFEAGTLFVYMKTHGTNYKGDQLIHCRLQFRTRNGTFFSSSEGWGVAQTFSLALDRLDRQIMKSKELEYDPEFVKKYLRRIGFPLTEL